MELAPLKINKKQEQFEQYVRTLNPNFAFYVDENGCAITEPGDILGNAKAFCVICENPKSYDHKGCYDNALKMTQTNFGYVTRGIKQSVNGPGDNDLCSGQLNKAFFSDIEENADVVFILYNIQGNSPDDKTYRFAGFVCCNDLSLKDENGHNKHHPDECDEEGGDEGKGGKTLYIDSICGKVNELGPELDFRIGQEARSLRIGNVLLKNVEDYAKMRGFIQLKLSALTYVINYYRKIGYLHNEGCNDVENADIKRLGNKVSKCIFKSEDAALFTYQLEKRVMLEPCTEGDDNYKKNAIASAMLRSMKDVFYDDKVGTSKDNGNIQNLYAILAYLKSNTICKNDARQKIDFPINPGNIAEICFNNNTDSDGPIGLYQLLTKLGGSGYTVSFDGENIVSSRQQGQQVDEDGDVIDMADEGYTMRKCIKDLEYNCKDQEGTCIINTKSAVQGGSKKKRKTKKNKKIKKHKKSKKAKKKSKKAKKAKKTKKRAKKTQKKTKKSKK